MSWAHYNPVRIVAGALADAGLGHHLPDGPLLLVTSAGMERRGVAATVMVQAAPAARWTVRHVAPNPELDAIDALAAELRGRGVRAIVALGGGSVIDAAKALSVLLAQDGERLLDRALRQREALDFARTLELVCVPTTAGTGAEVTPFATIWDGTHKQKYSLCDDALYPDLTILDPALTLALPWRETLFSALDACSHAFETLWNRDATPVSAALALRALALIADNLTLVRAAPLDPAARARMQEASLLAGLAISQNRTALAHAISYPLTARFGVPHGLACSFTLPALIDWVQRENAWTVAPPDALRDTLRAQMRAHGLGARVLGYCGGAQVKGCIGEMFNPERVRNFVMPATAEQVLRVLDASLAETGTA